PLISKEEGHENLGAPRHAGRPRGKGAFRTTGKPLPALVRFDPESPRRYLGHARRGSLRTQADFCSRRTILQKVSVVKSLGISAALSGLGMRSAGTSER